MRELANIHSTKQRFLADLKERPVSLVFSKWLIDRTPHICYGNRHICLLWKEKLAERLGIDSNAMCIIGSAGLGFSLSPYKNFKKFDHTSDIDVAIISHYYFEISWHALRNIGSRLYTLDPKQRIAIQEHVNRLIYWGTIATDKILIVLPFGRKWIKTLSDMARVAPTDYIRTSNHYVHITLTTLPNYGKNYFFQQEKE
jgi:hypothetical protein